MKDFSTDEHMTADGVCSTVDDDHAVRCMARVYALTLAKLCTRLCEQEPGLSTRDVCTALAYAACDEVEQDAMGGGVLN